MTAARPYPLEVTADLRLDVDGARATVVGEGSTVTVHASDPVRLWTQLVSAPLPLGVGRVDGPRAVGRVADGLAASGLTVTVRGPRGELVVLGAGGRSVRGRLFTGSTHVRPGTLAALRPLVLHEVWAASRRRWREIAIAVGMTGVAGLAARRAARRPGGQRGVRARR